MSVFLIMALILTGSSLNLVKADTEEEIKDYIVVAKDKAAFQEQLKNRPQLLNKEKSDSVFLQEDNILILQMTESEAALLSRNPDISIVEEDILVTANSYELEVINDLEEEDYTGISYGQTIPWNVQAVRGSREDLGVNANQPGIKIGILDSGIEVMTEIDVAERINFTGEDDTGSFASMYEDMTGHGTSVAGVIAAKDDNQGIVGINPNAEIYSLKVFDDKNQAPLSRIIEAIQYAIEQDISILNMSFGTTVNSPALHLKIREAYDADMLLIAAAGNRGMVEYPAAFEEVYDHRTAEWIYGSRGNQYCSTSCIGSGIVAVGKRSYQKQ